MYKQLSSSNKKTDALYQLEVNLSKEADTMDRAAQIMKQVCKGPPGEPYCTVCWWSSLDWMMCGEIQIENSAVCESEYREMQMYNVCL